VSGIEKASDVGAAALDNCAPGANLESALKTLGQLCVVSLLLQDIISIFRERDTKWLRTCDLLESLWAIEGRPWPGLTSAKLAELLRPQFIRPKQRRLGTKFAKGYERGLVEYALSRGRG
jgi:Protein of unknown function (DUF3631)